MREGAVARTLELMLRAFSATRRMHNKAWIADGWAGDRGRPQHRRRFRRRPSGQFHDLDLMLLGDVVVGRSGSRSVLEQRGDTADPCARRPWWRSLRRLRRQPPACSRSDRGAVPRPGETSVALGHAVQRRGHSIGPTDQATVVRPAGKARGEGQLQLAHDHAPPADPRRPGIGADHLALLRSDPRPARSPSSRSPSAASMSPSSPTRSPPPTCRSSMAAMPPACRLPLLQGGVRLFELQPRARRPGLSPLGSSGASLHTRHFSVDGRTGFVGSFNFDPRSAHAEYRDRCGVRGAGPWSPSSCRWRSGTIPSHKRATDCSPDRMEICAGKPRAAHGHRRLPIANPRSASSDQLVARLAGVLPINLSS